MATTKVTVIRERNEAPHTINLDITVSEAEEQRDVLAMLTADPDTRKLLLLKILSQASVAINQQGSKINTLELSVKQWKARFEQEREKREALAARVTELEQRDDG